MEFFQQVSWHLIFNDVTAPVHPEKVHSIATASKLPFHDWLAGPCTTSRDFPSFHPSAAGPVFLFRSVSGPGRICFEKRTCDPPAFPRLQVSIRAPCSERPRAQNAGTTSRARFGGGGIVAQMEKIMDTEAGFWSRFSRVLGRV